MMGSQKETILETLEEYLFPGQPFTSTELMQALAANGNNIAKNNVYVNLSVLGREGFLSKKDRHTYVFNGREKSNGVVTENEVVSDSLDLPDGRTVTVRENAVFVSYRALEFKPGDVVTVDYETNSVFVTSHLADL